MPAGKYTLKPSTAVLKHGFKYLHSQQKRHKIRFIPINLGFYCYLYKLSLYLAFLVGSEHLSLCWSGY